MWGEFRLIVFFYHPDYTVGTGIAPVRELALFADFTAGGELHSAPKKIQLYLSYSTNKTKRQAFEVIFSVRFQKESE